MDRKQAEHVMEMKYNLNITNEEGVRKNGSKIVWTKQELDALEGSFGQIPLEHMAGNKKLKELRREDIALWDGKPKTSIGGMHSDGVITVFDSGSGTTGSAGFRHGGDNRELASPYICSKCGTKITVMDMVVTHEIGHDIHDQNDATFDKYKKASGWESHSEKDLKKAGLTDAEIQQMKTTRPQGYGSRTTIIKNGKIYMVDPYNKSGFLAVDDTALPAPQHADPTDPTKTVVESETGAGGTDKDTWAYARSNFKDHFAEHYAKAVHTPEKLYKDLVEHPAARTQELQTTVATWQQQLDALKAAGADATAIADRQKQIDAVNNELAHAQKAQKQRKAEFDIMRNDIFHADTATNDAYARLKSKGVSEDKLREFQEKAAQASTPEQIKTLETAY
jgi:flagellar biosynthesis chaperone FliJ